jgi:hypothetical protein
MILHGIELAIPESHTSNQMTITTVCKYQIRWKLPDKPMEIHALQ